MASNIQETAKKATREKSPLYPAVTIKESYEFIKQIDSLGGKSVSYASILSLMGLTSPTTRSFLSRISASKQFGFITTGSSTAQLTDIAKRILYPTNEHEAKNFLVDSFNNPPLYQKLIERYRDKAVPPKTQLANILMNEYRIIRQVKDNAAECFIESAEFLGLLTNGVLCFDNDSNQNLPVAKTSELDTNNEAEEVYLENKQNPSADQVVCSGYNFEIATLSQKSARFYIPAGVTSKDLDYLKMYVENMLPAFIDNLKDEIKQE